MTSADTAAPLTTDAASYLPGQRIVVAWAGLPGNAGEWLALAPQGSDQDQAISWAYTDGPSGTLTFTAGSPGTYVARAFLDESYTIASESAAFTITAVTVTTDAATYGFSQDVVVTWAGLSGTTSDWLALAPAGAPTTAVARWIYTGGAASGSATIGSPAAAGIFTARAFYEDSYTMAGESAAFTIGALSPTAATDLMTYATDQDIVASWTGLQGVPGDWVALAAAGAPLTEVLRWVYAGGAEAGTATFAGGLPAAGSYVVRTFSNDTYNLIHESAAFDVADAN